MSNSIAVEFVFLVVSYFLSQLRDFWPSYATLAKWVQKGFWPKVVYSDSPVDTLPKIKNVFLKWCGDFSF